MLRTSHQVAAVGKMRARGPGAFQYGGSKKRNAHAIIDALPPASIFIDLFAGACSLSIEAVRAHKYTQVVANDKNPRVWRTLMTLANRADEVAARLMAMPQGRPTFELMKACMDDEDDVAAAAAVIVVCAFASEFLPLENMSFRRFRARQDNSVSSGRVEWTEMMKRIRRERSVLHSIGFENLDWPKCVALYSKIPRSVNKAIALFVCDPPYQNSGGYYKMDFDHAAFMEWARGAGDKTMIAICDRVSADMGIADWKMLRLPSMQSSGFNGSGRTAEKKNRGDWLDVLWLSPATQRAIDAAGGPSGQSNLWE